MAQTRQQDASINIDFIIFYEMDVLYVIAICNRFLKKYKIKRKN